MAVEHPTVKKCKYNSIWNYMTIKKTNESAPSKYKFYSSTVRIRQWEKHGYIVKHPIILTVLFTISGKITCQINNLLEKFITKHNNVTKKLS